MSASDPQSPLLMGDRPSDKKIMDGPVQLGPFTAGHEPWRRSNSERFEQEYCVSFVSDKNVAHPVFGSAEYIPEKITLFKDTIYAAISALEAGLEYAQECLIEHDTRLGRTIRRNKEWAENIEIDIKRIKKSIEELKNNH